LSPCLSKWKSMILGTPLKSLFGCLHRTPIISLHRTFFNRFISCRYNGMSDTLSLYKYVCINISICFPCYTCLSSLFFFFFYCLTQIAGGSGITPMLQVIEAILKNPDDKTQVGGKRLLFIPWIYIVFCLLLILLSNSTIWTVIFLFI